MLIARAPFRISLAGGGTDLPGYTERFGGMVVSTTIDKYVYVLVAPRAPGRRSQITSADFQTFYRHHDATPITWDGDLALPRAVLHAFDVRDGVSVFVASEVPPGTGLGSSSAVAVAVIAGVAERLGRSMSRDEIAELACTVELDRLQAPIGKQDQYAAAFGGFNAISFQPDSVQVDSLSIADETLMRLERRLLLFFTGRARNSATILREQRTASERQSSGTIEGLHRIRAAADACRRCLEIGDLDGIGLLLDEGWQQKRLLASGITDARIDDVYAAPGARRLG